MTTKSEMDIHVSATKSPLVCLHFKLPQACEDPTLQVIAYVAQNCKYQAVKAQSKTVTSLQYGVQSKANNPHL